jgi:hypothetical protein
MHEPGGSAPDLQELAALLRQQNTLLQVLVSLTIDESQRNKSDFTTSRFGSLDELLSKSAGLTNVEIGKLLGKTPQSVGQMIASKAKH